MASEYIKRARSGYDALNRTGDADSILSELDPDVEIILPGDAYSADNPPVSELLDAVRDYTPSEA